MATVTWAAPRVAPFALGCGLCLGCLDCVNSQVPVKNLKLCCSQPWRRCSGLCLLSAPRGVCCLFIYDLSSEARPVRRSRAAGECPMMVHVERPRGDWHVRRGRYLIYFTPPQSHPVKRQAVISHLQIRYLHIRYTFLSIRGQSNYRFSFRAETRSHRRSGIKINHPHGHAHLTDSHSHTI